MIESTPDLVTGDRFPTEAAETNRGPTPVGISGMATDTRS